LQDLPLEPQTVSEIDILTSESVNTDFDRQFEEEFDALEEEWDDYLDAHFETYFDECYYNDYMASKNRPINMEEEERNV